MFKFNLRVSSTNDPSIISPVFVYLMRHTPKGTECIQLEIYK